MSDKNLKQGLSGKYFVKDNTFFDVAKTNPKDLVEKEIGDSKTPGKFLPQQKVTRWDNEANVSIRLVHDEKTPDVVVEGDDVVWKGKKVEARFYDVFNEEHPEGAGEFEIVLKEKPATNVVEFTVQDKDVEYFYQPELTAEEIAEGASQPANVIGSYAVYAKTPKTNWTGGKEYKTGKVGHIFRPKIIDSANTEVWGDLHIENGILSVTIPQDFLDKAVYPVRHAAGLTFGYTTSGGTASGLGHDNIRSTQAYTPASNGDISSVHCYGGANSISSKTHAFRGVLYLDSDNSRVTFGSEVQIVSTSSLSWRTLSVSSAAVSSASSYMIGFWFKCLTDATGFIVMYDALAGKNLVRDNTVYHATNDPPATYTDSSSNASREYSIYATYTAAGSTSPSLSPSLSPSISPSQSPSASLSPSISPSISPSQSPSASLSPSISPSISPSQSPSASLSPSLSPSISPSQSPSASLSPSISPSISPSQSPSASLSPSISPSSSPSQSPSASLSPSISPSASPSQSPSASLSPSISPSISPSQSPSASLSPSISPSLSPSLSPSISPSQSPSASLSPSVSPSSSPSQSPSASLSPSLSPSISPSQSPSASLSPSVSPSASPSQSPSASLSPSVSPSLSPSQSPSASISPSVSPSIVSSISPSMSPSLSPSISPSQSPSASISPSRSPSISPSQSPSASLSPSLSPSVSPSQSPSASLSPSVSPSLSPSQSPSASLSPSLSPSESPSQSPSSSISPSSAPYGAILKRWDGSTWVKEPLKVWNGSAWVSKPLYYWDGSTWVDVDTTGI